MPSTIDPRTLLAAERTYLAWLRTGLALMGFGFVVARFGLFLRELQLNQHMSATTHGDASLWLGTGLVGLGVAVEVAATLRHIKLVKQLGSEEPFEGHVSKTAIAVALLLALSGVVLGAYLVFVR